MKDDRFETYCTKHRIEGKYIVPEKPIRTLDDAVAITGYDGSNFIKNICVTDKEDNFYIAVLQGSDRLDTKKLKSLIGTKISMASPEKVEEHTGYKIGTVPPFGENWKIYVDTAVMEKNIVLATPGNASYLFKFSPSHFTKMATICDLKK